MIWIARLRCLLRGHEWTGNTYTWSAAKGGSEEIKWCLRCYKGFELP